MSLGYAERLSFREDLGGRLGAPEIHQSARAVLEAAAALARLLAEAERVVVFTGAGISTACGVPDFRGPNGVWTLQRAGRPLPRLQTSFAYAQPSFTHMVGRTMGLGEEGGESAAASHGMGWDGAPNAPLSRPSARSVCQPEQQLLRMDAGAPVFLLKLFRPSAVSTRRLSASLLHQQALLALLRAGKVTYICSQNVE